MWLPAQQHSPGTSFTWVLELLGWQRHGVDRATCGRWSVQVPGWGSIVSQHDMWHVERLQRCVRLTGSDALQSNALVGDRWVTSCVLLCSARFCHGVSLQNNLQCFKSAVPCTVVDAAYTCILCRSHVWLVEGRHTCCAAAFLQAQLAARSCRLCWCAAADHA